MSRNSTGAARARLMTAAAVFGACACRQLAGKAVCRSYTTGEILFREDASAEWLFVLGSGRVGLDRQGFCRRPLRIGEVAAPAILGTTGLFDGGANGLRATALLATDAELVPGAAFLRLCRQNGDIALRCARAFAGQMRELSEHIDINEAGTVRQRLARLLMRLSERQGATRLVLPLSHSELAARLDTVREIVWRSIRWLDAAGLVSFHGHEVTILDPERLRALTMDDPSRRAPAPAPPACGYFTIA